MIRYLKMSTFICSMKGGDDAGDLTSSCRNTWPEQLLVPAPGSQLLSALSVTPGQMLKRRAKVSYTVLVVIGVVTFNLLHAAKSQRSHRPGQVVHSPFPCSNQPHLCPPAALASLKVFEGVSCYLLWQGFLMLMLDKDLFGALWLADNTLQIHLFCPLLAPILIPTPTLL